MQKVLSALLIAVTVALVLGLGCSEDSKVVGPKGMAAVRGQVYIYNCGVCDVINNSGVTDFRFAARTGQPASVTLVNLALNKWTSQVCDLDGFALALDTGTYDIFVETGYSYPDTFKTVRIRRDTVLDLNIVYDWHLADSMFAVFTWWPPSDSVGEFAERQILDSVAEILGRGVINPDSATRSTHFWSDSAAVDIIYTVPLGAEVPKWAAVDREREVRDVYRAFVPELFYLSAGYWPCLAGQ